MRLIVCRWIGYMAPRCRDVRQQVGLNVQRIRRERGLSQEALAFEAEIHRTYISGVERGGRNPTVTVVEKIARALNVPASRLLEEVAATKS